MGTAADSSAADRMSLSEYEEGKSFPMVSCRAVQMRVTVTYTWV